MGSVAIPASGGGEYESGSTTVYVSGAGFTQERTLSHTLSITLPKIPKMFAITYLKCGDPYGDCIEVYRIDSPVITNERVTITLSLRQFRTTAGNSMPLTVNYVYI